MHVQKFSPLDFIPTLTARSTTMCTCLDNPSYFWHSTPVIAGTWVTHHILLICTLAIHARSPPPNATLFSLGPCQYCTPFLKSAEGKKRG